MGWIRYLFKWDKRPRIPSHLVTRFDWDEVSPDERLVLMAGKARDRHYVARLMRLYQADNAAELLARLPKRKRPSVRKRIRALIMRAEGSLPYDPIIKDLRRMRAEGGPPVNGMRRVRMKGTTRR
jgi:hypothetical protein